MRSHIRDSSVFAPHVFRVRAARVTACVLAVALAGQALAAFWQSGPRVDRAPATWIPDAAANDASTPVRDGGVVAQADAPLARSRAATAPRGATTLQLKIVNSNREPLAGAKIFVNSNVSAARAESGADGVASVVVPTGLPIFVRVALAKYEWQEFTISELNKELRRDVELVRAAPLRGRITDETGEPVAGAEVSMVMKLLMTDEESRHLSAALPPVDVTDIRGNFTFPFAPRRGGFVRARKPGYVITESDAAAANPANAPSMNDGFGKMPDPQRPEPEGEAAAGSAPDVHLCMTHGASIEGVVRDANGAVVGGCEVVVVDLDGFMGAQETPCAGRTAAGGFFQFTEVPAGRRVAVRAKTSKGNFDSEALTIPMCERRTTEITLGAGR